MSLRTRLTLASTLVAVVLVTVAVALVWIDVGRQLRRSLDAALRLHAEDVRTDLAVDPNAVLDSLRTGRPAIFTVILAPDGRSIRRTPTAPELPTLPPAGPSEMVVDGEQYALYALDAPIGRIVTGASLAGIEETRANIAESLLAVGTCVGLVAVLGGWWLVGRALRPVARLATQLESIEPGDLERRVALGGNGEEIDRLVGSVNAMLGRLDDGLRRQQAFVAAASHDLRTPIAALRTELELALRGRRDAAALRRAIEEALGDATRLSRLADGLLALAEAEPGGRPLARSRVAIAELVEAAVDDVRALAEARGVRIETVAEAGEVAVDRVRLEQAIRNLLANAVRFTPDGGAVRVRAEVTTRAPGSRTAGRRWLSVIVIDEGPGVDPAIEPRLFLPFPRRDGDGEGTGLGLAMAAAAVRAHGGEIGYRRRPTGGSEFWLTVPG